MRIVSSRVNYLVPVTGIDLHFCLGAKIKVATSVCTGGSRCPPDICIWMGSIPLSPYQKKHPRRGAFFGAGDRDRTGTDFTPRDFKSLVSACSTTPAWGSDSYGITFCFDRQGSQLVKIQRKCRQAFFDEPIQLRQVHILHGLHGLHRSGIEFRITGLLLIDTLGIG